ncbi:MAG: hypothetical protein EBZ77_03045 [Chitinophagia bacterium]|nr:hypothetical protein [Chitinophagia bacterium]
MTNGNVTGGDILLTSANGSITAATGKTVIFYSGNANTSNLSRFVTNGNTSQQKTYSTAAYNGSVNVSRALNVFYRVSPSLTISNVTVVSSKIYDGTTNITANGTVTGTTIDGDTVLTSGNNLILSYVTKNVGTNINVAVVGSNMGLATALSTLSVMGYKVANDSSVSNLRANIALANLTVTANAQNKTYIERHKSVVEQLADKFGIPYRVILGIAIVESSSGTSKNTKKLKNHFGIVGKNNLPKGQHSRYKSYASDDESFLDFCKMISRRPFYNDLKDSADERVWIQAISTTGYSEKPEVWRKRVLSTISSNKL